DIRLDVSRDEIPPGRLSENEFLVTETILDRQIVDIDGLKVVRVNDILLGQVKRSLCLVGVDVGFKGIIRRLGFGGLSRGLMARLPNRIVPWSYIDPLDPNLRSLHLKISRKTINDLHPADIADILEELNNRDRLLILDSLGEETAAEAMEEVDPEVQATMVNQMESDDVADILENMNPDDAADLLGIMPENKATEVLELMNEVEAEEVRELMAYSNSSAGSLMTTDYVAVPSRCTVSNIFSILRRSGREVDMIYYIYVQSDSGQLLGVMSLRDLLLAEPDDIASTVMKKEVLSVLPTSTIEEVTNLLSKYDFLCVPVADEEGRILGIVTFDDALDEIIPEDLRKRMPWNYHKLRRIRGMD
ncbi:MAG TPA: CBS domain-containing protein, partial [Methanothrix soehngenii]|nr:CBS domain-containing protein [Methanothrix soehngenii]